MRLRPAAGFLFALWLLAAAPAPADLRETEAVGAVPLYADKRPASPPRDAAERKALSEAVRQVALQLLSAQDPAEVEPRLGAALGADPKVYISRFRTLEDRGERPVLFSDDPQARAEYVVVVEAQVDADRVREALSRGGLPVTPAGEARRIRVRVEAEGSMTRRYHACARRCSRVSGCARRSRSSSNAAGSFSTSTASSRAMPCSRPSCAPPPPASRSRRSRPARSGSTCASLSPPTPRRPARRARAIDTSNPNRY